ncbi:serine/threonine-protein kinase [Saccharomonospora sp. NPDC046836]|uniref:serine/threonine-protein kinase n=1 Tax=Saccharomonospora sp. NPDC046836 TaxID=3156921 RepID=UPI0033F518BF
MQPLNPGEPRQAGRYRLLAVLGAGGMGRVLLAASPDGRLAAVKQIHPGFAHDQGFRDRFRREVETSRRVSGAYTAAVMDADPDAATPWLASLYVAGPSLREAVDATGPLPVPALRSLAAGLAVALADIHRAGLVHRDLKPSNVLLAADGPRVIDFGIARALESDSELTRSGSIIGSPAFMSPEQAEGHALTPASDVFSLGALLVMAATGTSPFTGTSTPHTLYNVVHAQPDLGGLPPEIRGLAEACLAKEPAARPTPQQLLDLIGPITPTPQPWPPTVHQLITTREAAAQAALDEPAERGRNRLRIALVALAVSAVAGGAVLAGALAGLTDPQAGTALPASTTAPTTTPTSTAPTGPLSPQTLRAIDPCRVLGGDREPAIDVHFFSCTYETPSRQWLELTIGGNVGAEAASGELENLPLIVEESSAPGVCEATVLIPDQPNGGVSLRVDPGAGNVVDPDPCGTARTTLGEAVRTLRAGQAADHDGPRGTLATADACALADEAEVAGTFDMVTEVRPDGLHACEWDVSGRLTVSLERAVAPGSGGIAEVPVELGGRTAYRQEYPDAGSPGCVLSWAHLPAEETFTEVVRVHYRATGTGLPVAEVCRRAEDFATTILPRLPQP